MLLYTAAALLCVAILISMAPAEAAVPIVPASETFQCIPVAVYDGDGPVWCAEGPRIRIAGVAAREMDGTCRANQPGAAVDAIDARDRLVRLLERSRGSLAEGHVIVRSATMSCRSEGSAGGSRTAAWCKSPAFRDLSCAVVRAAAPCAARSTCVTTNVEHSLG
jgi:hypothetical protein